MTVAGSPASGNLNGASLLAQMTQTCSRELRDHRRQAEYQTGGRRWMTGSPGQRQVARAAETLRSVGPGSISKVGNAYINQICKIWTHNYFWILVKKTAFARATVILCSLVI